MGPTGLIFAMRSRLEGPSGDETFYNEVDSAFSGQNEGRLTLLAWLMVVWFGYNCTVRFKPSFT